MEDSSVERIIRPSALRLHTSQEVEWSSLIIERRCVRPGSRHCNENEPHYYGSLWVGGPSVIDHAYDKRASKQVLSAKATSPLRFNGGYGASLSVLANEVIRCTVPQDIIGALALVNGFESLATLNSYPDISDNVLSGLFRLAVMEACNAGETGKLYGESIILAIINRLIFLSTETKHQFFGGGGLPPHILRRVLEKMTSKYRDNLSLTDLAHESGYSKSHFLRMFKASTGSTPYGYLLSVRLEVARQALLGSGDNISEIAYATGFSSHSHLTRAFQSKFGVSPAACRRGR